jgi:hypothetical protein
VKTSQQRGISPKKTSSESVSIVDQEITNEGQKNSHLSCQNGNRARVYWQLGNQEASVKDLAMEMKKNGRPEWAEAFAAGYHKEKLTYR